MRYPLLATVAVILPAATVLAATSTGIVLTPGSGSMTDTSGNVWSLLPSGSIEENGAYVPGGGGTAELTLFNGTVYGKDAHGRGWFALSASAQYWTSSAAPSATVAATTVSAPVVASALATTTKSATTTPTASTAAAVPTSTAPCGVIAGGAATGAFTTANGQIYAPDGSVFIARGVDIMAGDRPAVSTLQAAFPGLNFVRIAIDDYASAASLQPYVSQFTSAGIVVELGDYYNGSPYNNGGSQGVIFTGQQLQTELAWYSSIATTFKSNPAVWFSTNNEPSETNAATGQMDPAALSIWQQQTYNAIRTTGNNSLILLEANSWGPGQTNVGYTPSVYIGMTNVVWDIHQYGWLSGYSTNQSTVTATLTSILSDLHAIGSADGTMPTIIGEYGNSTTGMSIDPNGDQVLTAVQSSGYGSAAWAWGPGNPGDGLSDGGSGLSAYGQEVAGYIALIKGAPASIWACSSTAATQTGSTQVAVAQSTPTDPASAAAPAADPTSAGNATAQQSLDQGDAIVQQAQSATSAPDPTDSVIQAARAQSQAAQAAMTGVQP